MKIQMEKKAGKNFTLGQLGNITNLEKLSKDHPMFPGVLPGKVFLKRELRLTGMEVSINKFPAGTGVSYLHKHNLNEELYIFFKGEGQFQIDGKIFDVKEGTVIRVSPNGARSMRNNSSEDLYCIIIQAVAGSMLAEEISDGINLPGNVEWEQESS
jgi:mannose-6-phosphate isomerase-like protein (cupin superfamily)